MTRPQYVQTSHRSLLSFGSALNPNPHLHILMLDGVYVAHPDSGQPVFVAVPPPSDELVQRLIEQAAERVIQVLQRHGVLDDTDGDALAQEGPSSRV